MFSRSQFNKIDIFSKEHIELESEINNLIFDLIINTEGLLSYSIPKGIQRGIEIDLSDKTYDGRDEGDRLVGGLGQLVDGQRGTDNFRSDIHGFGKGNLSNNYTW